MLVKMLTQMSGTRNGDDWPPAGTTIELPADEAETLIYHRMAEPVAAAPVESAAVNTRPTIRR